MSAGVVIVGGGLAGQRCAEGLRRAGYERPIRIVCDERHRPYDRPPLSKEALAGDTGQEALSFRSEAWYSEHAVELLLDRRAVALDARARRLELAGGASLPYERLLIATGARPRRMALFEGFENVSTLRTSDDAGSLRRALAPGSRLLVVGAGFIGQEAACAAHAAGAHATIVEAAPAPLAGLFGRGLGTWFAELHRSHGTQIFLSEQVVRVRGNARVESVTLSGGVTVECDHVLVGVGVEPSLEWLGDCGLERTGVRTDELGRSEIPDVFAAGDAAAAFEPSLGRHAVGSHWESAARAGARVARTMLGLDAPAPGPSSFWSDLYGMRIQYLGHVSLADGVSFDGDPFAGDFAATFTRAERPVAVLLAGRPQQLPHARALLNSQHERTAA